MSRDQKKERRCYQTFAPPLHKHVSGPQKKRTRENHMEINSVKSEEEDNSSKKRESEKRAIPHEEVNVIPFNEGNMERTFIIGSLLGQEHQKQLITLIREFEDVFAWRPEDMPGIDPAVALHKLYVDPGAHPMKQKKRLFNDEKNAAIQEELQTL
ncbi:hypothetical protein LIER_17082 [Lithospermum erythrorhizon]|uniref:Uncharacterized protein n=1 Tax=Lithospermum erythrorhizon TaxID=34254 RepID=A0AAV3QDC9_LITER